MMKTPEEELIIRIWELIQQMQERFEDYAIPILLSVDSTGRWYCELGVDWDMGNRRVKIEKSGPNLVLAVLLAALEVLKEANR